MYTTFQATNDEGRRPRARGARGAALVLAQACSECRRRKSRCDGKRPCNRCEESAKAHLCVYVPQKRRVIPSQKTLDELSAALQQCRSILEHVFPNVDPQQLGDLSQGELQNLIRRAEDHHEGDIPSQALGSAVAPAQHQGSLALEQLHEDTNEYDEESPDCVGDDVNALSGLSTSRHTSYVGSSSVAAALKVIAALWPDVTTRPSLTAPPSPYSLSARTDVYHSLSGTSFDERIKIVDAYFAHVHVLIPMVNEEQFRKGLSSGDQGDSGWCALVNIVLALGSIAKETTLETTHVGFFQQAKAELSLDSFGSGKLTVIQALALMGGLYLHYCNRPNMAAAVMGAALRMAYALGLHRRQDSWPNGLRAAGNDTYDNRDVRRRTWWSLVCLDTWGSMTLGRPSMGDCFGPAITAFRPSFKEATDHSTIDSESYLAASVQFCELSADLQNRLASSPCLPAQEIVTLDSRLREQYASFPGFLRGSQPCPRELFVPRGILKWRYQNARLLLHRPILLAAALARKPLTELLPAEQESIEVCRTLAGESIIDIACDWQPDAICGWNAAWYLFQATMIPLVSLFYECQNGPGCEKWHGQVDISVRLLQSMINWSPVAQRTKEVIIELQQCAREMSKRAVEDGPQFDVDGSLLSTDMSWENAMWTFGADWPAFSFEPVSFLNPSDMQQ